MSISRVTTWSSGQVLTASALNGEFNNIIDNALALISPLTGVLNVNNMTLQNIASGSVGSPGIYFNTDSNTGFYASAADVVDITAGGVRSASFVTATTGVNYILNTPAAAGTGPMLSAAGSDTDLSLQVTGKGLNGVLLGTNSGTPAANNLYRAAGVRGWIESIVTGGTPAVTASYNVTSITDTGPGILTVTWDRDFASGAYVTLVQLSTAAALMPALSSQLSTAVEMKSFDTSAVATDPAAWFAMAIGAQ